MKQYKGKFSGRASLGLLATEMEARGIWRYIEQQVHIPQKTVKHRPLDKLKDCFVNIVAGGQGVVEINTRVRCDEGLYRAFGRSACAEQSTVSQTLNRCGSEQVEQLRTALGQIYRQEGQGYRHPYEQAWQVLDIDLTGLRAGRQAEGATKGYFDGHPHARGRQLGRVLASRYGELVTERLYPGRQQLSQALQPLVQEAATVLELDESRRRRTLLRIDRGGGCQADLNWMLERGYRVLVKMQGATRVRKLAAQVQQWWPDPQQPHRAVAGVVNPIAYARPTQQVLVRVQTVRGEFAYGAVVSNAPLDLLTELAPVPADCPQRDLLALVYAYDQRGGGLETVNKADKQGLGLAKRNKRSFTAQEMLVLLAQLAHNLVVWVAQRLAAVRTAAPPFGILRLLRDFFAIPGQFAFDRDHRLVRLYLARAHPLSRLCYAAFAAFAAQHGLSLYLRKF